jgi:hypothetical protein
LAIHSNNSQDEPTSKKAKKSSGTEGLASKAKEVSVVSFSPASHGQGTDISHQQPFIAKWNAIELAGGDERQNKYLRLLGAGKAGTLTTAAATITTKMNGSGVPIKARDQELEKQFNVGLKMTTEANGKRRGLGA